MITFRRFLQTTVRRPMI